MSQKSPTYDVDLPAILDRTVSIRSVTVDGAWPSDGGIEVTVKATVNPSRGALAGLLGSAGGILSGGLAAANSDPAGFVSSILRLAGSVIPGFSGSNFFEQIMGKLGK